MAKHQSKEYRLNQLKTNILIFLRGPQEYIKENGTDYFEDESNFKKFRRGLDEIINSSTSIYTGVFTDSCELADKSETLDDHIYSRGKISAYILENSLWPSIACTSDSLCPANIPPTITM